MLTRAKLWVLLACCAAITGAFVGTCTDKIDESSPSTANVSTQSVHAAASPIELDIERQSPAPEGDPVATGSPRTGTRSTDLLFGSLSEDPAARQLLVQSALTSDQKGLATRAAIAIGHCLTLEARAEHLRASLAENKAKISNEMRIFVLTWQERELRMCQALDSSSRAQWLPLLRRGLAEAKLGDAEGLLSAFQGGPYEDRAEAETLNSLRADAFACHEASMATLYFRSRQRGALLTSSESAALWKVLKTLFESKPGESWHQLASELPKPDPGGDPAEVQQIVDAIRARC